MAYSYLYKNTAASATIHTGPGRIHSISLTAAGDTATAIVYDNVAASGTIIWKLSSATTTTESAILDVAFGTGCHVALTGTTPSFSIAYTPG